MKLKAFSTFLLLSAVFFACPALFGDIYHLSGNDWQKISDSSQGKYLQAVSNIKRLIAQGKDKEAETALNELKMDFPQITGPDFDAFMEAELLFAKNKYIKASRKYSEFLDKYPDSKFAESALERQYSIANAFLSGQKRTVLGFLRLSAYEEADNIMHEIADRAGDTPIAKRSLITLARGYQKRGKFMEAYDVWSEIKSKWPTGDTGRIALLEMAHSLHSEYKGPRYDSTMLLGARTYYKDFAARYPSYVKEYDINEKLQLIEEQLALKKFEVGKYYNRAELEEGAEMYYEATARKWPETTAAKMANDMLDEKGPEYLPKPVERKVFDAAVVFLDTWFGAELIF